MASAQHYCPDQANRNCKSASPILVLVMLLTALLGGCASYPSSIAVTDPDALPTLATLLSDPASHKGETVVFGGQIISVSNDDNRTVLEILQQPLWDSGRPQNNRDASQGRFRAELDHFVDPEIYKKGRMVSIRGEFNGLITGKIGNHTYDFANIKANGIELWSEEPDTEVVVIGVQQWGPAPFFHPRPRPVGGGSVNLVVPLQKPAKP